MVMLEHFNNLLLIDLLQIFLPIYLSVTGGRDPLGLAEKAAEIHGIVIADDGRDVGDRIIRGLQEGLRVADPGLKDVLHGRCARGISKAPGEPARRHAAGSRVLLDADILIIMLLKVLPCTGHLVLDETGDPRDAFCHPPVDGQQQFAEEADQHFLVTPGALHKLVPHPSEQILVIPGDARVKDVTVQRNLKVLENTADLPPCKVDKPHLGPVFAQVVVFLLLLWLIQHHVAGGHNDFISVEEEMSLSGCDINDLPVDPAFRPPGREQGPGVQLIGTCAQDPQGHFLLFKGHSGMKQIAGIHIQILNGGTFSRILVRYFSV